MHCAPRRRLYLFRTLSFAALSPPTAAAAELLVGNSNGPNLYAYDSVYADPHFHPSNASSSGLNNVAAYSLAYPPRLSAPNPTYLVRRRKATPTHQPSLRSRSLLIEILCGQHGQCLHHHSQVSKSLLFSAILTAYRT